MIIDEGLLKNKAALPSRAVAASVKDPATCRGHYNSQPASGCARVPKTAPRKRLPAYGKDLIARRTSPNPPIAIRLAVGTIWNGADLAVNPRDWQRGRYDWRVLADLFVTIIAGEWSDSLLDIVDEVAEYAGALFIEVAGRRYEAAELAASCARVGILSGLELGEVLPPSWWRADAIYARRVRGWVEMMERHHHAKP